MLKPRLITQKTDPRLPDTCTIFITPAMAAWTMFYNDNMYGDFLVFQDVTPGGATDTEEANNDLVSFTVDMLLIQIKETLGALVAKDAGGTIENNVTVKVLNGFVRIWKGEQVKDINFGELFADRPKVTEVAYFEPMRFAPPDVMEMFEKDSKFIFEPAGGPGGKDKAIFGIRLQSSDLK